MNGNDMLQELLMAARHQEPLKEALLATQQAKDPMDAFCKIATENGYPITVGELFNMDQQLCDDILNSTNGGATYPIEYWNDTYENFIAALKG